jgi:magnesium chelatase family protein
MPARVVSAALHGIDAIPVTIEVDVLPGLPSFTVVGLTDKSIQESRERLTAALSNCGYTPPRRKTIVSLAPASIKKEGSLYDLPIALAYLVASQQVSLPSPDLTQEGWLVGEVGLDGSIRPVRGVLPLLLTAIRQGVPRFFLPLGNIEEASAVADQIVIHPVASLSEVVDYLSQKPQARRRLSPSDSSYSPADTPAPEIDFSDIRGQEHAKRALLIAAASAHNVLLVGPPGTGKTLLARALVGILPPLTLEESYVVTSLYSVAGELPEGAGLLRRRPFRSPHHGASSAALVGGGSHPRPGEVSLAHHGVLFLDELPEFSRAALDQLRQPLEDGVITISRAAHTLKFPARSMLVGAMNPCKCGYLGSQRKSCQCPPHEVLRYQQRISGPLLDRFDLHVLVSDIPLSELLTGQKSGLSSAELSRQAAAARTLAVARQGKPNAALTPQEVTTHCPIDPACHHLLHQAENRFHLSSRAVHRLLKVARTIADLAGEQHIHSRHLAEALQYREQLKAALPDFV